MKQVTFRQNNRCLVLGYRVPVFLVIYYLGWYLKILKTIAKGIDKFSCYLSLYLQFLIDLILVLKNLQWYLVLTLSTSSPETSRGLSLSILTVLTVNIVS